MNWIIRQVEPEDAVRLLPLLVQVQALHAKADPAHYRADFVLDDLLSHLHRWMSGDATTTLAALAPDGTVLGALIVQINEHDPTPMWLGQQWGMLQLIGVDAAWRRAGIGLALIEEMKARLRAQGIQRLRADHAAFNIASAALMRKAGLEPFGLSVEGPV